MSIPGSPKTPVSAVKVDAGGVGFGSPRDGEPELLHEIFERQADARPDSVAVVCAQQRTTYRELEKRANRLAWLLRSRGVGAGDCVGLLLPRSTDVYVGLLGILKAGAAYVPIDPDYPADRVGFILADCGARALVTTTSLAPNAGNFSGLFVLMDKPAAMLAQLPSRLTGFPEPRPVSDLCYVIYTSGTTGQPKGVEIEHRSAVHLVRAEGDLFQVRPEDRVYQGFPIAFDASVEEIWLAFHAGATLVVGASRALRAGSGLAGFLGDNGVTVLSCVPTLMSMLEEDVPSVRLLIFGGEVCPPELIRRWWKQGRKLFNTYGPTEATVIAAYAECHPDQPVTIGRPLPNYQAFVLDETLRALPVGESGELCLGGIGLARGYVGRPELTREKFVLLELPGQRRQRVYRTGDLARWTANGELEFLGRIDTQVKIRGFRVELSEVETCLVECTGIGAAAVALREDVPGLSRLVAYVVARPQIQVNEDELRRQLKLKLPPYMIPSVFVTLPELPMLPSGKVDRSRLPAPPAPPITEVEAASETTLEECLAAVWRKLFGVASVSEKDDFFLDLGGHSLLAARMVSELRRTPEFTDLSMADVYQYPSIELLAAELRCRRARETNSAPYVSESMSAASGDEAVPAPSCIHAAIPWARHFLCGCAQAVSLVFVLSFFALQWLTPYLTYTLLVEEDYGFVQAVLGAFASLIGFYPAMLAAPIVLKWVLIGRYRAGDYPLWGGYYFRWWLVTTVESAVPVSYLAGTPLMNIYLRLMGARVGHNVQLHCDNFAIYDLLSIGDDTSINADSRLLGYTVEDGWLKLGSIRIGKRCFVGTRSSVSLNTTMEDESALEDLSLLPPAATIPARETWGGSPAQCLRQEGQSQADSAEPSRSIARGPWVPAFVCGLLQAIGVLVFPVLVVAALFPGIVIMNKLNYIDPYYWYLFLAPLVGLSFIVLLALEIAGLKWLVLGRVAPGTYPLRSFYYLRKWFVDQTIELSLDVLGPLYASIYLAPWYKLLGAKLGDDAEVSTASFISPDLLEISAESFVADSVSLGAPRVRDGKVTLGVNRIGRRSFIGNSAMLPPGTVIGDSVLIGCLSAPPANPADRLRKDSAWLGSPALFLPERQKAAGFSERQTFDPPQRLRVLRAAIEFVRVITPSTGFIILLSLLFSALLLLHDSYSLGQVLLFFPFLYVLCGLAAGLFTVMAKWLLVWRYKPGEKPLWSTFVWRNELLNALHEHLAEPFLVGALSGTPFLCWYFRLLGARIGRRVYMETTDLSEFDLVRIGDEAALNADCTIQTHLFEDRVMKMSRVYIGPQANVGGGSLVLYDTIMEEGSGLDDLSLLMKGERLPANSRWSGIPARFSPRHRVTS